MRSALLLITFISISTVLISLCADQLEDWEKEVMFCHVKYKGKPYILTGTDEGAITTERHYREGKLGVAYLLPSGEIMRHGNVIGSRDDIEFGEAFEPTPMFTTPNLN